MEFVLIATKLMKNWFQERNEAIVLVGTCQFLAEKFKREGMIKSFHDKKVD